MSWHRMYLMVIFTKLVYVIGRLHQCQNGNMEIIILPQKELELNKEHYCLTLKIIVHRQ